MPSEVKAALRNLLCVVSTLTGLYISYHLLETEN